MARCCCSASTPAPPRRSPSTAGRIVYVGRDAGAWRLVGDDTDVVNLRGRMLMPGLGDGHAHGPDFVACDMHYEGGPGRHGPGQDPRLPHPRGPGAAAQLGVRARGEQPLRGRRHARRRDHAPRPRSSQPVSRGGPGRHRHHAADPGHEPRLPPDLRQQHRAGQLRGDRGHARPARRHHRPRSRRHAERLLLRLSAGRRARARRAGERGLHRAQGERRGGGHQGRHVAVPPRRQLRGPRGLEAAGRRRRARRPREPGDHGQRRHPREDRPRARSRRSSAPSTPRSGSTTATRAPTAPARWRSTR